MLIRASRSIVLQAALIGAVSCTASVGCGSDDAVAPDGVLHTANGPFEGTLLIEPDPPRVGEHRVVLTLDGETSVALEGAIVTLSPWMPAHGHGSSAVDAVEEAPGLYVAEPVRLTMPGIWQLRVHVMLDDRVGELLATIEIP